MKRLLPILLVSMITSCASNETADSKDVKQSEIYQNYTVSWIKGRGYASASFRFGGINGTTLHLTSPSKVTYNDQQLTESKFLFGGAFYEGDQRGYSSKHEFKFNDADGKTYINNIDFDDVEFMDAPKTVSKDENLIVELTRPILASERIVLAAESDTASSNEVQIGNDQQASAYYDLNSQKLIIKPSFFLNFSDVPAKIWLLKEDKKKPIDQPTNLDGEFKFTFQSKDISVTRVGKDTQAKGNKPGDKI